MGWLLVDAESCYGRQEPMGIAYDPFGGDYVDELTVRRETARVFDVCMSCQQCINSCSVFPLMVSGVDNCVDHEAALLTPGQQDDIVSQCHQCGHCTIECPYLHLAEDKAVNFPALVIRHRAMLKKNNFISIRQQLSDAIFSRIAQSKAATSATLLFHGFLLRFFTHHARAIAQHQRSGRPHDNTVPELEPHNSEVTFFPTCVMDICAPEVGVAMNKVFAQVGVTCVGGDKRRCCGAPDLYNGNISRFRRTVAKNVRTFRNSVQQGRPIVVGQNRCLEVMRDHYEVFSTDPDTHDLVTQIFGASEFLCQVPAPDDVIDADKSQSPHLLTLLQSDVSAHTGTQHVTADVLHKWGYKVHVVEHLPVAETVWEIHKGRADLISRARQDLEAMLHETGAADIVSESCATNLLLRQRTHREIRHPMEVLAKLISASKPPKPQ